MIFHSRSSGNGKAVGAGLLGLAAGAAATYYLYATRSGIKKRAKITRFAKDMKDRASDAADEVTEATSELYENISETVKDKYDTIKNIDKKEVSALAGRIKEHWAEIREDIGKTLKS